MPSAIAMAEPVAKILAAELGRDEAWLRRRLTSCYAGRAVSCGVNVNGAH